MELITLPAYYANYLINGDIQDLELSDIHDCTYYLNEYGSVLTCSENIFICKYKGVLTECLDYTFIGEMK